MVRERLTERQATPRPDHLWPEIWRSLSRNAEMKEKQNWAKPELENARKLRGTDFIEPEDKEFADKVVKVHFASLMGICHLKNAELVKKHQKY